MSAASLPFHLPFETVLRNAREAFSEGRLQIQLPVSDNEVDGTVPACCYSLPPKNGKPCGCAIGVSIPPELGKKFDQNALIPDGEEKGSGIAFLLRKGLVTSDWPEGLSLLQQAHDNIVTGRPHRWSREKFNEALDHFEVKYKIFTGRYQ